MEPRNTGLTVISRVRADRAPEPVESTIATLREYQREGKIDAALVRTWPGTITLSQVTRESEAVTAFEAFRRWAAREGIEICPPFARGTRTSAITGKSRDVLVTPALCVATYLNGQLVAVHPHADGGERRTVDEALEAIRSERYRPNVPALVDAGADRYRCPICTGRLVDGQGLYACSERDCDWVGTATGDGEYRTDLAPRTDRSAPIAPRRG